MVESGEYGYLTVKVLRLGFQLLYARFHIRLALLRLQSFPHAKRDGTLVQCLRAATVPIDEFASQ